MVRALQNCEIKNLNENRTFLDEFFDITIDESVTPEIMKNIISIINDLRKKDEKFRLSEFGKNLYRKGVRNFHLLDRNDSDLRSKVLTEAENNGSKNASFIILAEQSKSRKVVKHYFN